MSDEPTKQRPGDQRLPTGDGAVVQERIIDDMRESIRVGTERYGTPLRTVNGRSKIQDVHEEVRDLYVYLTQVRMEAEADRQTLVDVVASALHAEGLDESGAEVAVDAIMGWVVGRGLAADTDGLYGLKPRG